VSVKFPAKKMSGLGPFTERLAVWTLVHCWLLGVLYMIFCILLFCWIAVSYFWWDSKPCY